MTDVACSVLLDVEETVSTVLFSRLGILFIMYLELEAGLTVGILGILVLLALLVCIETRVVVGARLRVDDSKINVPFDSSASLARLFPSSITLIVSD